MINKLQVKISLSVAMEVQDIQSIHEGKFTSRSRHGRHHFLVQYTEALLMKGMHLKRQQLGATTKILRK